MFFYYFMNCNGLSSDLVKNVNQFFAEDMFMIYLFYSNHLNISQNFIHVLMHVILICLFHLDKKQNGKLSVLDEEVFRKQSKFVATVYRKPKIKEIFEMYFEFLSASNCVQKSKETRYCFPIKRSHTFRLSVWSGMQIYVWKVQFFILQ